MDHDLDRITPALGLLAELFTDPDVQEIMVDSPERVLVERDGCLEDAGVRFESPDEIRAIISALLALNGEEIRSGQTIINLYFAGSRARGVAVLPPTALQGPILIIRKLMNVAGITWEKLVEWGSVTPEVVEFLRQMTHAPANLLVAGGTSSGKITLTARIAELIPPEQRLIVIENTHELQIHHPRAVFLEAEQSGLSFQDLIRTGTGMRPDWLITGELLGAEAMVVIEALGRGYSGIANIHASSLEDALSRLEAMCLTANLGLGLGEIRNFISAAFQVMLYQKRMPDGTRKIVEIAQLCGIENEQIVIERLFRFDPAINRLIQTGIKPDW